MERKTPFFHVQDREIRSLKMEPRSTTLSQDVMCMSRQNDPLLDTLDRTKFTSGSWWK